MRKQNHNQQQTNANKPNLTPLQQLLLQHRQTLMPGIKAILQMYGSSSVAASGFSPHCIVTELFVRFGRTARHYHGAFHPYAIRCARNLIIDRIRKEKRTLTQVEYGMIFDGAKPSVADFDVDSICLETVLQQMKADYHQAAVSTSIYLCASTLVQVVIEENRVPTQTQLAARLQIDQSSVSRRLDQCYQYLRNVIERTFSEIDFNPEEITR